jgi:homoserine kinase
LFLEKINSNQGIDIELYKKMPLNSGMGSSAASSVAALVAINELMENHFQNKNYYRLAMEGENCLQEMHTQTMLRPHFWEVWF